MKVGYCAIVGKPNVGKSTLINSLIGAKVSIVSQKPGTTRMRILGVKTIKDVAQIVFLDTPGIARASDALSEVMLQSAKLSLEEADVIVFLIDASEGWQSSDENIFNRYIKPLKKPTIIALNKIDLLGKVDKALPIVEELSQKLRSVEFVPISASKGFNLDRLLDSIISKLKEGEPLFEPEMTTDLPARIFFAEIIREKVLQKVHQEIPQGIAIVVENISPGKVDKQMLVISAKIIVEKESHKPIVIGKGGQKLKAIGELARKELELITGKKVFLELWVEVKPGWKDRPEFVKHFGYGL
ncbi:MAG: GTPase Era [Aquificaceae bacterium]|nr:GTPase Era [Aquificaceae bacterium]MDW8237330.1 GTPase Era [Aquificaceae bacterium]